MAYWNQKYFFCKGCKKIFQNVFHSRNCVVTVNVFMAHSGKFFWRAHFVEKCWPGSCKKMWFEHWSIWRAHFREKFLWRSHFWDLEGETFLTKVRAHMTTNVDWEILWLCTLELKKKTSPLPFDFFYVFHDNATIAGDFDIFCFENSSLFWGFLIL